MLSIAEGTFVTVTVPEGQTLTVQTAGETYVDRLAGLIDSRYSSERLLGRKRVFKARDMPFTVRIRAIKDVTEYIAGYPNTQARNVEFGRDTNGEIDAIIDPVTGLPVSLRGTEGGQGPRGDIGPAGPRGMQGEQGPQGPQGDLGPAGPEGPQGPQGERGPDGRSITILGRLASEAELPADGNAEGDAYIVTTEGSELVYYWFDGAWVGTGIAQGPEGPPGPAGEQGPQGSVGPAGAQGPQGPQGVQGPAGEGSSDGNPIGAVLQWFSPILPTGYIWADQYTAGEYPALDAMYPNGVPDFANRVFRHVGNLTGAVGTTQDDAMQRIQASVGHLWAGGPTSSSGAFTVAQGNTNARPDTTGRNWNTRINFDSNRVTRTATETRVKSVIFRAIIKAY